MKCDNCGENEANVKYTQIINGQKKKMFLCEKCSEELGINNINFNMPIDFSSFLSDFFEDISNQSLLSGVTNRINEVICSKCGLNFNDFMNTGKFGCSNCYDDFEEKIDPILKNIQGANKHIGRLGKVIEGNEINNKDKNIKEKIKDDKKIKIEKLKQELKKAIKEERYEDAAKIRDELKKEE